MIIKYERPVSHAARWARGIARFSCGLFLAALLTHRFGPLTTPHFLALSLLATACALVGVLLAAVGFVRLWRVAAVGGVASFKALVYAAVPIGFAGAASAAYFMKPALFDVSTDTAAPPAFIAPPEVRQGWMPRAAEVTQADREAQLAAYPGLTGRRYDGALDRVFLGVKTVAEKTGIRIVAEEGAQNAEADLEDMPVKSEETAPKEGPPDEVPVPQSRPDLTLGMQPGGPAADILVQGEWRTLIVGLRSDVVIRLREEAETTFVDMRVAARHGPHDLGIGARFANQFLHALDAELLGIAGD